MTEKTCRCGADITASCIKNGIDFLSQDDKVGVTLGRGDLYKCPACGQLTVSGFTIMGNSDKPYYQKELQRTLEKCQRLEAELRKATSNRPDSDIKKELDFYKPKTESLKETVAEFEKLVNHKNLEIDMLVKRCRVLQDELSVLKGKLSKTDWRQIFREFCGNLYHELWYFHDRKHLVRLSPSSKAKISDAIGWCGVTKVAGNWVKDYLLQRYTGTILLIEKCRSDKAMRETITTLDKSRQEAHDAILDYVGEVRHSEWDDAFMAFVEKKLGKRKRR